MPLQVRLVRLLALDLVMQTLACSRTQVPAPSGQAPLHVDVIAVGQGDSILLSAPSGKHLLIDGGEAEASPAVLAALRQRGACPLDMILLTHRHADHLGGLRKVVEDCGARLFMDSGYPHPSLIYARLLEVLEKRQIPQYQAEMGRQIDLGQGAILTLLGPPKPFIESSSDLVNANSVPSRLEIGRTSILFAADAEAQAEKRLTESKRALSSTVLKVGHHGSRTSSTAVFLNAVSPHLALVSNAAGDAKHPHPETLERLKDVPVMQTAQEGTIHLDLDGDAVNFWTEKHPEPWRLP